MYGRDVVSVSVFERTKVRVKALDGGVRCRFVLFVYFILFRIDCSYKARGKALA